ncbi:MAG: hypothetical protein Fur0037_07820 [Planctomycetota bacterium]
MTEITKKIGLSLGADLCWPKCFEDLMARLDLSIESEQGRVRFAVERIPIEPLGLRDRVEHAVVIDRLTHWYPPRREWIKKAVLMDGVYVYNNPWTVQAFEKHSTYCAMMALGMPIPDTVLVPPKSYDPKPDLDFTLRSYARMFDLEAQAARVGYPLFMKPFDGGGWQGVSRVENAEDLRAAYEQSGRQMMHLQEAVAPFDRFVRAVGLGPQVRLMRYDPEQPLHARYVAGPPGLSDQERRVLEDTVLTINAFFCWDFNSCEALRRDGVWRPIDFANPCPDSQVNSIHYHFPWYVKANIRWATFVAATGRRMRKHPDFAPFERIAALEIPYEQKLARYGAVAREHFEADRFAEFCERHLPHLDEVAWEYFGTDEAKQAVRTKVAHLYPSHEVEQFTELFWQAIQRWRDQEGKGGREP